MKRKNNLREVTKEQYSYGYCSTAWIGRHIKEYRYHGIPIMRWYSKAGIVEFLNYYTIFEEMTLGRGLNRRARDGTYYWWHRPETVKWKLRHFAPPGVNITGRIGRLGGWWIMLEDDPNPYHTRLWLGGKVRSVSFKYDGVV